MSTRIPSAPSSGPRKGAPTGRGAPCSRCAGPNTSPSKLWAIITWSRTVTANISALPVGRVGDRVAERGAPAGAQVGHQLGQLRERRGAGEQRVVGRVAQQVEG